MSTHGSQSQRLFHVDFSRERHQENNHTYPWGYKLEIGPFTISFKPFGFQAEVAGYWKKWKHGDFFER